MEKRETFSSRLGFLLISAGCAIGLGNVWRFPYITGQYGGGAFVLIYLLFLIILGLPVMVMELAVGRGSQRSIARSFHVLEPKGTKWHWYCWFGIAGNYLLMMFYTVIAGWLLLYCLKMAKGDFVGLDADGVAGQFGQLMGQPGIMTLFMAIVVLIGMGVCLQGLQNGVERITKGMMCALIVLIAVLAVHSFTLSGAKDGLAFFLLPDWSRAVEQGIGSVLVSAMNQAFFTLSLGIGAMEIFGSYMNRDHTLTGEAVRICALDTFVAVSAGLIIFPACFSYGVSPDAGPSLIFITLPNVFTGMAGGRVWGTLFFLFMTFASFTTVVAVFENIIASAMELFHIERRRACVLGAAFILLASVPCVLGFNLWSGFQPLGAGSTVLDGEDFIVSNLLLPFGSLVYLLFCVTKWGWGFDRYLEEANAGEGIRLPRALKPLLQIVLPILIVLIIVQGLI